jgi:hypothetical protein
MLPHLFPKPQLKQQQFKKIAISCPNLNQKSNCLHVQSHFAYLFDPYITYMFP